MLTRHIAVGTGGDVARGAGAGLRGHAACHGVQDQDDGVDEGWVWTDQSMKPTRAEQMSIWMTLQLCVFTVLTHRAWCQSKYESNKKKKKTHSHIQHVRVCELHKEVFVLEHPCTGKHRVRGNDTICILAWCTEMAWQCLLNSAGLTEGNWVGPEPWCRHDDLIQRLFVCQHFIDLSVEGEDRKSRLLM